MRNIREKIVWGLVFLLAFLIMACGGIINNGYAEAAVPSPTLDDLYQVISPYTYKHEKTYKWYRRDKDGNPLDSGAVFATGKVIYVDGDDVDTKTVFVCEVE